ncbi:two-component sensor histidine kinase [Paractinoplanes tereljensis]|uniref:histidine kinase n=1 Tax=Paractinoplanes tereljensis TaxID=571912 RepID=A0A919TX49_9ACTN|nr:two-component sensor histidine kinase [Actinoplanes tereljensis]
MSPGQRDPRASLIRQSILVAGACMIIDVLALVAHDRDGPRAPWIAVLVALAVADAALATPARWSGGVAVFASAVTLGGTFLLGGHFVYAGMLIAAYRAGAWLRGAQAGGVLAAMLVAQALCARHPGWELPLEALRDVLLPWMVGRYTTTRRAYLDDLERRADLQRLDARAAVERAVAQDRSAIARDLHDVIAHHVSAINVHAGAARLSLAGAAGDAAGSLQAVETASRAAMADLRHLLDVLHGEHPDAVRQPGLDNLDELLDGLRAADVPARLSTSGTPQPVPDSLNVALYRIAQEMLTNAMRHGDGTGVEVMVSYGSEALELSTVNGLAAGPVQAAGEGPRRGLAGIRNRARLFAGSASSGPGPGGRTWHTTVRVPLAADALLGSDAGR